MISVLWIAAGLTLGIGVAVSLQSVQFSSALLMLTLTDPVLFSDFCARAAGALLPGIALSIYGLKVYRKRRIADHLQITMKPALLWAVAVIAGLLLTKAAIHQPETRELSRVTQESVEQSPSKSPLVSHPETSEASSLDQQERAELAAAMTRFKRDGIDYFSDRGLWNLYRANLSALIAFDGNSSASSAWLYNEAHKITKNQLPAYRKGKGIDYLPGSCEAKVRSYLDRRLNLFSMKRRYPELHELDDNQTAEAVKSAFYPEYSVECVAYHLGVLLP